MQQTTPDWRVQAVFDCAGHGGGFAYTIGLAGHGLDDLHLAARPIGGDDPGGRYALSSADLVQVLNRLATEWIGGSLSVGDERVLALDGGRAEMCLRLEGAVPKDAREAFGASTPMVVPISWVLRREPIGAPTPLNRAARRRWARRIMAVSGEQRGVSFDVARPMGPMQDWVAAVCLSVFTSRPYDVVDRVLEHASETRPDHQISVLRAAARPVGRVAVVDEATELAHGLVRSLRERQDWKHEVAAWTRSFGDDLEPEEVSRRIWECLTEAVVALMAASALADVLTDADLEPAVRAWRQVPGMPV